MKKYIWMILSILCVLSLAGCNKIEKYEIEILIPADSTEAFVYSDEEIRPTRNKITIWAGAGFGDTEVIIKPVNENIEAGYVPEYLTHGVPVEFDTDNVKDQWFKIGVSVQNDSDRGPIAVSVEVEGVEVRIEEKAEATFEATILEIHDNYYLVEPVEGSQELMSADKIEVSMKNLDSSLEPETGDVIEIVYDGVIMERYPAILHEVYSIKVVDEAENTGGAPLAPTETNMDLDSVSHIEVMSGLTGQKITVKDANSVQKVMDDIESLRYEKKNAVEEFGYAYRIRFYNENYDELGRIFITEENGHQISYDGYHYLVEADQNINVDYLEELLKDAPPAEPGDEGDDELPDREPTETIAFHDKTFNKSDLSKETIEWLEWYNGLSEDEQLAISYVLSDLYEICGYPTAEDMAVEETITYNGKEYKTSELCKDTLYWLGLSEQERMFSSYLPPEFMEFEENCGIILSLENITATGATIKCEQSGGEVTGELETDSWYIVERWTQMDGWKEIETVIDKQQVRWISDV